MTILDKLHIKAVSAMLAALFAVSGITSCGSSDKPEYTSGAKLRFIYDYNMEYANAFMHTVDCLTVYIYDEADKLVQTRTETSSILADESYRMIVDLPEGKYRAVAYGGLECKNSSFTHPSGTPSAGQLFTELALTMNPQHYQGGLTAPLHDLYYGSVSFSVSKTVGVYTEATVGMIKDTNNVRVLLQHVSGQPVDPADFTWELIDDNTHMTYDNKVKPVGAVTYTPWAKGQAVMGAMDDGSPILAAYGEFSVARFVTDSQVADAARADAVKVGPILRITRPGSAKPALDVPLNNILLQMRSRYYADMKDQEYLDRQSQWTMLFLLNENDRWNNVDVKVNDWVVRINDIDIE